MKLKAIRQLLMILTTSLLLASCQKEIHFDDPINNPGGGGTGNNRSIIGDWDFVGMTANTSSTVTASSPAGEFKTVTVSGYVTQNNVGTVKITASEFISTGLGYSIDTTMNLKTYLGGLLIDDMDFPFVVTTPPTSSTSAYTRINNDSLTTTGAFGVPDPSGGTPLGLVGVRIGWAGDTLLLKIASTFTQNITQGGVPGVITASVSGISRLKRR